MYTVDDAGRMNNYAVEPAVYCAEYPSEDQQQYAYQAAFATLLVTFTILTAFAVSQEFFTSYRSVLSFYQKPA